MTTKYPSIDELLITDTARLHLLRGAVEDLAHRIELGHDCKREWSLIGACAQSAIEASPEQG